MLLGVFFLPIQLCAPGSSVLLFFRGSERETQSDTAYQFFKQHPQTGVSGLGVSACRKSLFAPLNKFSELYKSSENLGFQWRRETGEAPPVADQASLFRGRLPISGYAVSADWLEPTVYPFLGYLRAKSRLAAVALRNTPAGVVPRTPFTRKGYAASVKRRSR